MDLRFRNSRIFHNFFDGRDTFFEILEAKFFEFGSGKGDNEIFGFG